MILNPNKTKALGVSRSMTVNPPHENLVLSGVSICASPIYILEVKFDSRHTFEDHVHGIISCVSERIGILRLVKPAIVACFEVGEACRSLCIVLRCGGLLLNVILSFLSTRCIRGQALP